MTNSTPRFTFTPHFAIAAFAFAAGCADGDRLGSAAITAEQAEPLCKTNCEYAHTCDPTADVGICTEACVADMVGWARGDAVQAFFECTATQACGVDDIACLAEIEPLAIHREWESGCRSAFATCALGAEEYDALCTVEPDPSDDENGLLRFVAPEIVRELIACLAEPACSDRTACVARILTAHGIDVDD